MISAIVSDVVVADSLRGEMVTPSPQSDGTYGLGVVSFRLACGTFLGHAGAIAGTHAIVLIDATASEGLVLAINVRGDTDPDLLAAADELLCADR
jgi:hypothetical protein